MIISFFINIDLIKSEKKRDFLQNLIDMQLILATIIVLLNMNFTYADVSTSRECKEPSICGSCYGAGVPGQCCKTCQDIMVAYERNNWDLPDPSTIEMCRQDLMTDFQISIPVEKVPCRAEHTSGYFAMSSTEACKNWRYVMSYFRVKELKCERVVTEQGETKIGCNPNYFKRAGIETHVKFEDLDEKGIGVKIDHRELPKAVKTFITAFCFFGFIGMIVAACHYCPELPPSSDDDFTTGFIWGSVLSDTSCSCTDWSDDYFGGTGLVE